MLKPIILALTLLTTAPAQAQPADCALVGDVAQSIMEERQSGVPMSDAMRVAGDNEALRAMVVAAYSYPRFSSDSYRKEAATDFRNEIELICYGTGT